MLLGGARLLGTVAAALLLLDAALCSRNHAFIGYTEKDGRKSRNDRVKISSAYGSFVVKLRPDLAPETCKLVWELAQKGACKACNFYRHEPVPSNWGVENYRGPPYALLQGSLADLAQQPPFENKKQVQVKKGNTCIIPGSREFFIATADHPEWGASHTVWGDVEDLAAEPSHPYEPYRNSTDGGGITTRWLVQGFAFNLTALPGPGRKGLLVGMHGMSQEKLALAASADIMR